MKFFPYLLCFFVQYCNSARIFVYVPLPFYSHQAAYRPLWRELADRGHQLTVLTLNPMESHPNITQVDLSSTYRWLEEKKFYTIVSSGEQSIRNLLTVVQLAFDSIGHQLRHPQVATLINGNETFDLVITEYYTTVGSAFAYKFKCPLIGVVSMDASIEKHNLLGNPTHPVLYPPLDLGFNGRLDLKQRLISALYYIAWNLYIDHLTRQQDTLLREHFGSLLPPSRLLEKNISLLFVNSNPVFHGNRPLGPQTINVGGGLHIAPAKPLPQDMQKYLDSSRNGVVYFSLGSSIRSSQLSNDTKEVIIETFARLPYDIMWKFKRETYDTFALPANVRITQWAPQQDVLRHPNVKLFITQGGLQSLEEALFSGVPVLVLPFFGDQIFNALKVVEHGFGLQLDHKTLQVTQFKAAIETLITNERYKLRATTLANQVNDRPMTSVQLATWWTEYVLRNRNVDLLKHPRLDVPFYQYFYLDAIFAFALAVLLVKLGLTAIRGTRSKEKQH